MGTYQMGLLANSKCKPFYVVAESHKFVRLYPLSQFDLPIEQKVLDFKVTADPKTSKTGGKDAVDEGIADMALKHASTGLNVKDAVDFTVCFSQRFALNVTDLMISLLISSLVLLQSPAY